MSPVLTRRAKLGAGALLAVLLLVVGAAGALAVYYSERADAERRAADREAGRVFALWFQAAHRASQEFSVDDPPGPGSNFTDRVGGGGFLLSTAELRGLGVVPLGLPERAGRGVPFALGIIDDGNGVPMAFGVVEPEGWAHTASLREGALEGGLAQIEDVFGAGSEMHDHVAEIQTVLGRAPSSDALFLTADRGVRYRDGVVYRRAQPGQSRLNRMETALNAGGCGAANDEPCNLVNGGPVGAEEVSVTPDPSGPVPSKVGGDGKIATWTRVGTPASPSRLEAASFSAVKLSASELGVSRQLVVGSSEPGTTGTVNSEQLNGPSLTVRGVLTVGSCAGCYPE